MSALRNVEDTIGGFVERVFGRLFRGHVEPVELARKLAREMEDHKTVSVSRVYVPNEYVIYLSPGDRNRFSSFEASLTAELGVYVRERARHEGFTLLSAPQIKLETDADLRVGEYGIACRVVDPPAEAPAEVDASTPEPVAVVPPPFPPAEQPEPTAVEEPDTPAPVGPEAVAQEDAADAGEDVADAGEELDEPDPFLEQPAEPVEGAIVDELPNAEAGDADGGPADEPEGIPAVGALAADAPDVPAPHVPEAVVEEPAPEPEPEASPPPAPETVVDEAPPAAEPTPEPPAPEPPPAAPAPVAAPAQPEPASAAPPPPAPPVPLAPPAGNDLLAGVSGTQIISADQARAAGLTQEELALVLGKDRFVVTKRTTTLGRSRDCDIVVQDANASRQHAEIRHIGLDYFIVDNGSTNGTVVNGQRVRRHALAHGDRITIGTTELVVEHTA